ncbi:unnamed protein product [Urochloa humidicola]
MRRARAAMAWVGGGQCRVTAREAVGTVPATAGRRSGGALLVVARLPEVLWWPGRSMEGKTERGREEGSRRRAAASFGHRNSSCGGARRRRCPVAAALLAAAR